MGSKVTKTHIPYYPVKLLSEAFAKNEKFETCQTSADPSPSPQKDGTPYLFLAFKKITHCFDISDCQIRWLGQSTYLVRPPPPVWKMFRIFIFLCQRSQKACNRPFHFFLFSSILVECKETKQFAVIQCRWLFNCTGVHSSLYTVDCTRVLEQPGMNIFIYVLVQGWIFSST